MEKSLKSEGDAFAASAITAVRRIQFASGHRVHGHETKCKHAHGHNYVAYFHARAAGGQLDQIGRVIDFGVMKQVLGAWIDANWDHAFIAWEGDAALIAALRSVPEQKLFLLPTNPTAENMARHLLHQVCPRLLGGSTLRIERVVIWETENCFAEAALDVRR